MNSLRLALKRNAQTAKNKQMKNRAAVGAAAVGVRMEFKILLKSGV